MPTETDRTAGRVDWPTWADRTPAAERERTSKYSTTLAKSITDLDRELADRLGVDDWRLSTAAPHRKSDGRPYANASPDDPAAVVRWRMDGEQYAVACDRYTALRDNVRTVGLYIKEKRKMQTRPVKTGQDEFATARLPSGDEPEAIVLDDGREEPPHEVLGVAPDAPTQVVRAAARRLSADVHPDRGGDEAEFKRIQNAKEALLDG